VEITPATRLRIFIEVTVAPRIFAGTTSAKYRGAVDMAMPITIEFQKRPITKAVMFGEKI